MRITNHGREAHGSGRGGEETLGADLAPIKDLASPGGCAIQSRKEEVWVAVAFKAMVPMSCGWSGGRAKYLERRLRGEAIIDTDATAGRCALRRGAEQPMAPACTQVECVLFISGSRHPVLLPRHKQLHKSFQPHSPG